MDARFGNLLGGLVQIETATGGDRTAFGLQGFVPRPRFGTPGFGRIEGILPRAYVGGSAGSGGLRYIAASEYDFERIPVPGVTTRAGPHLVETSATTFGRLDIQATKANGITLEAFLAPATTDSFGLSPRRDTAASAFTDAQDVFGGVTDRHLFD